MHTGVQPRIEDIEQIAATVFSTMLGLEFQTPPPTFPPAATPHLLTAAVQLEGEWHGSVLLHCMEAQAREFAACFLQQTVSSAADDDVRDVLGELVNMIAGNLKCTLCPGIRLSLPQVVEGAGNGAWNSGQVICKLGFDTRHGPFWLCALDTQLNNSAG